VSAARPELESRLRAVLRDDRLVAALLREFDGEIG